MVDYELQILNLKGKFSTLASMFSSLFLFLSMFSFFDFVLGFPSYLFISNALTFFLVGGGTCGHLLSSISYFLCLLIILIVCRCP